MGVEIGTPIQEPRYRAGLELLDRYQGYFSEIVRLSLLGMAGLGFFAVKLPAELRDPPAGARSALQLSCLRWRQRVPFRTATTQLTASTITSRLRDSTAVSRPRRTLP